MKYLKRFEHVEFKYFDDGVVDEDYRNFLKSKVNFEMIDDICDMSLDYIDKGTALFITIMDSYTKDVSPIIYFYFNHKRKTYTLEEFDLDFKSVIDNIKSNGLIYEVSFTISSSSIDLIDKEIEDINYWEKDVVDRIKLVYPNENVISTRNRIWGR